MSDISLAPEAADSLPTLSKPEGLLRWVASVDHKQIGIMYMITALVFLLIGGFQAILIRLQLAVPNGQVLSPETYNQMFTMHGTTMIFLVLMPMLIGFGNYFVPLMIGAHDMAFPRMNALGLWLLVFGGLLMYYSFLVGQVPDGGWTMYPPLSEQPYTSHRGPDYWALSILVMGIGSTTGAINFIVTVLTMRAPGMTLRRMPVFVWTTFATAIIILFAIPILNAGLVMIEADRLLGARFFHRGGGSPVLYEHVFWAFGHPEVYILILPVFGIISEIIPVFSRKPIFGYEFVVGSSFIITFLSFGVWAHHMFASGLGLAFNGFTAFATMLISVPTGIKVFSWIATMWGGKLRFTTAMLFVIGFLITFTIGGITGVTFAIVPTDWQTHDTYYVVAHLHYVFVGGTLFGIYAAFYYWFPKMTGRMLSEKWGKIHFWLNFVAFNLTFFIQHFLGLIGMPRRVYTYPDLPNWGWMNMLSSTGSLLSGLAHLLFMANIIYSLRRGKPAADNPWDAWTLEWATTSPPPPHNFDQLPPVRSARPLWDLAHPEDPDWKRSH